MYDGPPCGGPHGLPVLLLPEPALTGHARLALAVVPEVLAGIRPTAVLLAWAGRAVVLRLLPVRVAPRLAGDGEQSGLLPLRLLGDADAEVAHGFAVVQSVGVIVANLAGVVRVHHASVPPRR